ncbi:MAG: hypothetical protein JW913_06165 [Chitinispirillaceae bacterium]|nr:hypothetical protein [Chitinispirillaceae bacterium]
MSLIRKSLLFSLIIAAVLSAETHITGDITGMTFESGGNPFIVEQDILIPAGNKAVIKEGCVFLFKPFTGLAVHGHLLVDGTQEQPVIFTSINDGEYNTTSEQLPNPFDWNGILVSRESGTVSLKNFCLRFSVYGIKSQNTNIQIDNGLFRQNGQFHFTINDKIQFVQDNLAYSYSGAGESAATPDKPVVPDKPGQPGNKKESTKTVKIIRYSCLGAGIAGTVVGVVYGIKTGIHYTAWNEKSKSGQTYDDNKERSTFWSNVTGTIIGSSFGVLGLGGFGITFLF